MEGDNITVSCNGSGSPLPDVDWTVKGLHSINTHQVKATHLLHAYRAHRCSDTHILITRYYPSFFLHSLVKRLLAKHSLHQPHARQRKPGRQRLHPNVHLCERGRHDQHVSSAGCAM